MDKLDIFQERFGKVDKFGWWDIERIQTDAGMQFTSKYFQEDLYVRGLRLALAAPDHHEMSVQVELTWQIFLTIAQLFIVNARVSDKYIHFVLMYITDHINSCSTNQALGKSLQ